MHIHACMYIYIYIHKYMYAKFIYIFTCAFTHIYIYILHAYIYMCIHTMYAIILVYNLYTERYCPKLHEAKWMFPKVLSLGSPGGEGLCFFWKGFPAGRYLVKIIKAIKEKHEIENSKMFIIYWKDVPFISFCPFLIPGGTLNSSSEGLRH